MTPDLAAALIAIAGGALIAAGWRMERATTPPTTTEGADDAQAVPAEDL